jgi:hypothetical protein
MPPSFLVLDHFWRHIHRCARDAVHAEATYTRRGGWNMRLRGTTTPLHSSLIFGKDFGGSKVDELDDTTLI